MVAVKYEQLQLRHVHWESVPVEKRRHRLRLTRFTRTARAARMLLQLPLFPANAVWGRHEQPAAVVPALGGPDPERPCDGCAGRVQCHEPCVLLARLISPSELVARNEISSPALMSGRGYDQVFMVQPEVEREEEAELLWPRAVAAYRPMLRGALHSLTPMQRSLFDALLSGKSRAQLRRERRVSRQAIHKSYWNAIERIKSALGTVPSGEDLLRQLELLDTLPANDG